MSQENKELTIRPIVESDLQRLWELIILSINKKERGAEI